MFLVVRLLREKRGRKAGRRWAEQRLCFNLLLPKRRTRVNKQPWPPLISLPASAADKNQPNSSWATLFPGRVESGTPKPAPCPERPPFFPFSPFPRRLDGEKDGRTAPQPVGPRMRDETWGLEGGLWHINSSAPHPRKEPSTWD